jgi:signal transduction histidine kinase
VAVVKGDLGKFEWERGYYGPSDWLGEAGLLGDALHAETIKAILPTELMAITHSDFWRLMGSDDQFRHMITETLIKRLLKMQQLYILQAESLQFIVNELRSQLVGLVQMFALFEDMYSIGKRSKQQILDRLEWVFDLSRLVCGPAQLELGHVNIGEIIEQFAPDTAPRNPLRKELPQGVLLAVSADQRRVGGAIELLIKNADIYTRDGEVTVRAWSEGGAVWVAADDSGPGIPAKVREELLDKPYALLYPRLVAEAYGGELRIEDRPDGQGTRLLFSLPVEPIPNGQSDQPRGPNEIDQSVLGALHDAAQFYSRYANLPRGRARRRGVHRLRRQSHDQQGAARRRSVGARLSRTRRPDR